MKALTPQPGYFDASVEVPGSKSISNRALILAALSGGKTRLLNLQFSDDSRRMLMCLRSLGIDVDWDKDKKEATVVGTGGLIPKESGAVRGENLFVGNAGTAARFLPCLAALGVGAFRFTGDPQMQERPMAELIDALVNQGSKVNLLQPMSPDSLVPLGDKVIPKPLVRNKSYPFELIANGLAGGSIKLDITRSTQFASGLMMAAPYAKAPLKLELTGDRTQIPYVDMTVAMMKTFGVEVKHQESTWEIPLTPYATPGEYLIEPDFSGACYFFAAAALIGGKVTVKHTRAASIQGDIRFLKVLQHMGCSFFEDPEGLTVEKEPGRVLKGVEVDMNAFSDQALTLAALAPFCDRPVSIRNVAHIRNQECDRIEAIVKNLRALGGTVEERPDGVTITPGPLHGGLIETFGDHRVAMAFSLLGLKVPGVQMDDPACVAKTFENYWDVFAQLQESHA
jgi:3-phosphoshikimate 1-carboxyvinyltransferase